MRKIDYENNAIIMLDNAPYHSSKETKDAINKLMVNVYFLPPYSSILAPVEQFFNWLNLKLDQLKISKIRILNKKKEQNIIIAFEIK